MSDDEVDEVEGGDDEAGRPAGAPWPVLDSEVAWATPYFDAGYDVVERPGRETERWYWIDPADVVAVVAVTEDEDVVLVDQPDPRLQQTITTCPGGGVDDGESFVAAGVRELREETGYRAGEADLLTVYRPTAWARMDQAVVYATDLEAGEPARDPGEELTVRHVPTDEALATVRERSPPFGPALTSLLLAREEGLL